jgi:hypothetical protein
MPAAYYHFGSTERPFHDTSSDRSPITSESSRQDGFLNRLIYETSHFANNRVVFSEDVRLFTATWYLPKL